MSLDVRRGLVERLQRAEMAQRPGVPVQVVVDGEPPPQRGHLPQPLEEGEVLPRVLLRLLRDEHGEFELVHPQRRVVQSVGVGEEADVLGRLFRPLGVGV